MIEEVPTQAPWWQPGLILFSKLSAWIAVPIVIALYVGKFLDKTFNTEPFIFFALTSISFLVSTFAIYYEYTKVLKKIEAENNKKEDLKKE